MAAQLGADGAAARGGGGLVRRRSLFLSLRVRRAVREFTRHEQLAPARQDAIVKFLKEVATCGHDFAWGFGRSGALILLGWLNEAMGRSDGLVVIRCLLLYARVLEDSVLNDSLLQSVYEQRFVLDKAPFVDGDGRHDVSVVVKTFSRYLLQLVNMRHVVMRVGEGDCNDVVRMLQHGDVVSVVHLLAVGLYTVQCAEDVLRSVAQCAHSGSGYGCVKQVQLVVKRDLQTLWHAIELAVSRVYRAKSQLSGDIAQEALQVTRHLIDMRMASNDACAALCDALQTYLMRVMTEQRRSSVRRRKTADRVRQLNQQLLLLEEREHDALAPTDSGAGAGAGAAPAPKSVRFADGARAAADTRAADVGVVSDVRSAERVACPRVSAAHVSP
ncbi:hypothetical protein FGB62_22g722 [Gracilaria domingensis]|nr:hypothetical protein FGB62_22g722 [Gracilaria domingensis]